MEQYIAFLRGINVSGKNQISMAELKAAFEQSGFEAVKTFLNSGNVLFAAQQTEEEMLRQTIEEMIKEQFDLKIPVFVIAKQSLETILKHAPDWWGTEDKGIYDNLILIMKPATFSDLEQQLGEPKAGLEQIHHYRNAVFWSFSRKDYQKTNWWSKTATAPIRDHLTIRTAGTLKKICSYK
ncbi:MAG: DUF1697 domain-containing protein [Solobacterium sp.]|jgi:uncharacterized protein (DUF1697 family)|nr:DUF1697 domain-containing protein [Solobacterium sp.]MCH4223137.1 DUF1697 domain-containing protein [Solobacterium sp.]MCH4266536.1 DUF1697 domain-containing protein [Solobacterium sp.]